MITMDIVPGVHGLTSASTNLYVVEDGDAVTIIDAGLPSMWSETTELLRAIGRDWPDVAAFVLTHGHFDHVGILARAKATYRTPVWAHPRDRRIVRHPYRYRPGRPRLIYPVLHPRSTPHLGAMLAAGAWHVRGSDVDFSLEDGQTLDLPGRPTVVATPGHTEGHCALHLASRDIIFTGDALVTLDPYTGRTGPRVVGQGGTQDAARAKASLSAICTTNAGVVAPGHGEPWTGGVACAVDEARRASLP